MNMERRSVELTLRSALLNSSSSVSLSRARMVLLPIVFGAAMSLGIGFDAPTADAASICSPVADGGALTGTTTCVGSQSGISFTSSTGNYFIYLGNGSAGATIGTGSISVDQSGFNVSILDNFASSVNTVGGGTNDGLHVLGSGGDVFVDLSFTSITSDQLGIYATTFGGASLHVVTAADLVAASGGVFTDAGSGASYVQVGNVTTTSGSGVAAFSTSGDITIFTPTGTLVSSSNSSFFGAPAILGQASGGGNVTITANGNVSTTGLSSSGNDGIRGNTTGGWIEIHAGNISASDHGISALTTSGNITIFGNGSIAANMDGATIGDGINAQTSTGAITITTNASGVILNGGVATSSGIVALNTGAGAYDITIATGAAIGNASSPENVGINAQMTGGGSGNISVNAGGTIWSVSTGIYTATNGAGNITVITQ